MLHLTPTAIQSKSGVVIPDCATGGDATSGGTLTGNIIDRMALGHSFTHAQPAWTGSLSGVTSTAGARYALIQVGLKHGDSSGGGDLAAYATGLQPDAVAFFTTQGESTDWRNFTTGLLRYSVSPKAYPLLGAKRFIAPTVAITRPGLATSTAAGALLTGDLHVNMIKADEEVPGQFSVAPGGIRDMIKTTSTAT